MASNLTHEYSVLTKWTGADLGPARDYTGYSRDHVFEITGKPPLMGSADPLFRGDASRHNPEDLLLASLSGCHMLWYLHLATDAGIEDTSYTDQASGMMQMNNMKQV